MKTNDHLKPSHIFCCGVNPQCSGISLGSVLRDASYCGWGTKDGTTYGYRQGKIPTHCATSLASNHHNLSPVICAMIV